MRRLLGTFTMLAMLFGHPVAAGAHRLDEYLQATRVAIDVDRVGLEIDLTPGVSVAPQVMRWIDTNRDGQISPAEGLSYAQAMLNAVTLSVDGRPAPLTLVESRFPDFRDMTLGVGAIRLRLAATVSPAGSGGHHLSYINTHRPDTSVYLVNALVPNDPRVRIDAQHRDSAQHAITIDYDVTARAGWTRISWLLGGLATVGLLAAARRPRGQPSIAEVL